MWKEIKNYEGYYKISKEGEVLSLYTDKFLKPCVCSGGYLGVSLVLNKKKTTHLIHRLVANHFLDNPLNLPVINHKDGGKLNNHVSNLEWCTYKENTKHAIETGLMKVNGEEHIFFGKKHSEESKQKMRMAKLGKTGKLHHRSIPVAKIDKDTNEIIEVYESQGIAAKINNLHQGLINAVIKGRRKTTGGYKWKSVI